MCMCFLYIQNGVCGGGGCDTPTSIIRTICCVVLSPCWCFTGCETASRIGYMLRIIIEVGCAASGSLARRSGSLARRSGRGPRCPLRCLLGALAGSLCRILLRLRGRRRERDAHHIENLMPVKDRHLGIVVRTHCPQLLGCQDALCVALAHDHFGRRR